MQTDCQTRFMANIQPCTMEVKNTDKTSFASIKKSFKKKNKKNIPYNNLKVLNM